MKRLIVAAAFSLCASIGMAGPQYLDDTGFAASGYDVVAYFSLPQSAIGTPQTPAVPGNASITADYNGSTFAFSTEENRTAFLADPARYAPQFDGHCAYGVAQGGKVPGNPNLWRIVDDKLYLNIVPAVVGFWEEDIPGNISKADGNWVSIEPDAASSRAVPDFTSPAPVTN